MGYWDVINKDEEKELERKYGYEWLNFTPDPAFVLLNPFDLANLNPRNRGKLLKEFHISEVYQPADFRFRKGSNEGYIISIDTYDRNYNFMGTLDFKFLNADGARKMVMDLQDPDYQ